jgi:protein TonB
MEANKILTADILDIVFDGRNKSYGAYELRKTYNKRMVTALIAVASLFLLIFLAWLAATHLGNNDEKLAMIVQDVQLEEIKSEEKKDEPPPPPPPPKPEPPKIEMAKFTPPKIVKDEEVKEDEKPPEQEKLTDVKIALTNQEGLKDEGIVAPPVSDAGKGVVSAPAQAADYWDQTFTKVEIESEYPRGRFKNGSEAWNAFLQKQLGSDPSWAEPGISGTVVVQFVVDKTGNVSDITIVSGPQELRPYAEKAVKKSGKWIPAIQNGHQVKSYKKQPISFQAQ